MTKKSVLLVVCLAVVCFAATFAWKTAQARDAVKERVKIEAEWFKNTQEVVKQINDKEANEVFQFLSKNAVLAEPYKEGMRFIEQSKNKMWYAVVPVLETDKNVSEYWSGMFDVSSASNFVPNARALVIKDYIHYSPRAEAIVMLHEGKHAYTFVKNPYEGEQSHKDYCYEEVRTHTFQNRVMSLLGGMKYQDVLNKEVARIGSVAKFNGKDFSVLDAQYNEQLKEVFGKPASKTEEDFIQASMWLNAVFVVLDNHFGKDSEDHKAQFLYSLYKKDGILRD